MSSVFHEGEIQVQSQAGVRDMASRVGNGIHPAMPPAAQEFLSRQPFVVLGKADARGYVWASIIAGAPGFIRAEDAHTVISDALPVVGDPLHVALTQEITNTRHDMGLLAIEPATRKRMRVNGRAEARPAGGFTLHVAQAYANCPKYIQARTITLDRNTTPSHAVDTSKALTEIQQAWIANADTFFIASAHPHRGTDASHRGGAPGFVQVISAERLLFPDYSGNTMFNTLGNLAINPQAGLLFADFTTGDTLQLTGKAEIVWDEEQITSLSGAERAVSFQVREVVQITNAVPLRGVLTSYSPFNP